MVIFGGLEVVAAGYLIHKHAQNKKERDRLREAEELIEEEEDALRREARRRRHEEKKQAQKIANEQAWMAGQQKMQNESQYAYQHPPQGAGPYGPGPAGSAGYSQSFSQLPPYPGPPAESRPERRQRSGSRERRSRRHRRDERDSDDDRRDDRRAGRRREHSAPPTPTQFVAEPGIVTGWPANWQQSHTPQPAVYVPPGSAPMNASTPYLASPHGKERRGRSADETLMVDTRRDDGASSPRVRFNDGSRPGDDRSPPPRYE